MFRLDFWPFLDFLRAHLSARFISAASHSRTKTDQQFTRDECRARTVRVG
jgi:hypothetical protein